MHSLMANKHEYYPSKVVNYHYAQMVHPTPQFVSLSYTGSSTAKGEVHKLEDVVRLVGKIHSCTEVYTQYKVLGHLVWWQVIFLWGANFCDFRG